MEKRVKLKKKFLLLVVVLAVVGGFAANKSLGQNGSVSPAETASQPAPAEPVKQEAVAVDPCVLFDEADIERIYQASFEVGLTEEQKETADHQPITKCEYRQSNDGSVAGLAGSYSLAVLIENYNSAENAKAQADKLRSEADSGKKPYQITSVDDIGDEAFFYTSNDETRQKQEETLTIVKGPQIFKVTIAKQSGIEQERERTRLKDLANTKL